ncbi:MAG: CoB--CoM heterodisulfide reductase subunit C [Methanobrevibacter sp.]|nr:CoB--CoM heterodisulfide reductase subunit C [Candidatus Methanoflexus mossambicus]
MSWLKRLKGLFGRSKSDVIENNSEEEVSSIKVEVADPIPDKKVDTSEKKIAEEKKDSSVTNVSKTPKSDISFNETKESIDTNEVSVVEDNVSDETDKSIDTNEISVVEDNVSDEDTSEESVENLDEDSEDKSSEIAVEENEKVSEDKECDKMTLLEDNDVIRRESVDPDFTQIFKDAGIDTVEHCFQCGTCSGGCPSGRRTPYRVRQVIRKCLMGLKDEVISDPALWMCTTCYTCQERCPRSVKIVEIIKLARNVAAQNGYMSDNHKATGANVIKTGHGVPINDATKELRKRVGLSELPPTTHSNEAALKEIQAICKATGFDRLIDYKG